MAITSARKTRLENRITKWEAYLAKLETMYADIDDVSSYTFNSGEATQSTRFRDIGELTREMQRVEAIIERLYRILQGVGVANMNLRRV